MDFLTIEQVAEALSVKPSAVRKLIKTGRLRASKIGTQWRILLDDLAHIDRGIRSERAEKIGEALLARAESTKTEVTRSFSYKLNLGNFGRQYESADFFMAQKTECAPDDVDAVSEMVHDFCKKMVMRDVRAFIQTLRDQQGIPYSEVA